MSLTFHVYKLFIDPMLRNLRSKVASLIPEDSSVIEIASGTGAQSLILAQKCRKVVGIDIDDANTFSASKRAKDLSLDNINYHTADGRDLSFISDKEFDFTTITLALHELNDETRMKILTEMKRVSKHLIIADYSTPLPKNVAGWGSRHIEMLVGGDHYAGFKNYMERGGLLAILEDMGFIIESQHTAVNSAIIIIEVTSQ
jgi:ubiquinone/menaquinone biosynthesis C-methylase UbiE